MTKTQPDTPIVVMTARALAQVHRAKLRAASTGDSDLDMAAELVLSALVFNLRKPEQRLPAVVRPAWERINQIEAA